jgi:glycyl-tRNA synthetase (class II)
VDYQTLDDQTVTVRNRDDATQERVDASHLATYIRNVLKQ